jgi:DNA-binding transcriptional LysR family regulator
MNVVELRQMQVVVAVAETGGFSAAGRRLRLVQSAVSATVRAVERELRSGRARSTWPSSR